ncbi:MAG: protein kinase [Lachnospiraceae bacterium]|nr:protein kinase [Lachnospiraceae bacterium]
MSTLTRGQILEDTYQIIEEIGAGGGGIVFKAKHLRLQTDVVIKKIKDEIRSKVNLRQEADLLKNLKHPCLPRVYDFIETEDGVYTVMDFIRGEDLDTAVKRHGKYSQKEVKKWAGQLGEVLDYLHGQNPPIIHSDIKPANIMLTDKGDICLIDFNISLAAGVDRETAVGISVGFSPPEQYRDPALFKRITYNYTQQRLSKAPAGMAEDRTELLREEADTDRTELLREEADADLTELLQEEENTQLLWETQKKAEATEKPDKNRTRSHYTLFMGRGIDTRSDIYSLGITLYYLLTAIEPPVDFEQRIPIQETGVAISEGFALILEKMLKLDPADRYQDGRQYLKAIQNCHKLDKRYIAMYRKQNALQLGALGFLMMGILLIFTGAWRLRVEKNATYYSLVEEAGERIEEYEFEEALRLLEEAKQLSDTRIGAYKEEVWLHYASGSYEDCIKLGEGYINTIPFTLEAEEDEELLGDIYFLVGNAYFEQEDYLNAKNLFEYALQYNTKNGIYYRDYAITLAKMGQLEEAENQMQNGIEAGIAQDSVAMVQGELAHVKGEEQRALELLNQAIMLTEDMQMKKRAVLLAVDVYRSIGDSAIDEEISLLEKYSAEFQEKGNLVMGEYLADAYVRKAGTDEEHANEYYHRALELFEKIADRGYKTYQLQENIAILYQNMDQFDEAEELLLEMAEQYPDKYEVYKRLAYLEADRQQMLANQDRSYIKMKEYYEGALSLYDEKQQDSEMEMLKTMMEEIKAGGWF